MSQDPLALPGGVSCLCAVMCGTKERKKKKKDQTKTSLKNNFKPACPFFCLFSSKPNIDKPLPRHPSLSTFLNPERGRDGVQSLPLSLTETPGLYFNMSET